VCVFVCVCSLCKTKIFVFFSNTHLSVEVKLQVKKELFFHRVVNVYAGQWATRPTLQTFNSTLPGFVCVAVNGFRFIDSHKFWS
jgi:hypothetical protein